MFFPLRDHNPTRKFPFVTYGLILLNVVAYAATEHYSNAGYSWLAPAYGVIPRRLVADPQGEFGVLISSMFLHANLLHLGGNLLFLNIFGDNLEEVLGRLRYLAFYLVCGVLASLLQVGADMQSAVPIIGASGAIAGVVGGYLLLYPRAPVLSVSTFPLMWFVLPILPVIPAWWIAGEFFVVNFYQALEVWGETRASGVAVFAHLGGFIAGLILIAPMRSVAQRNPRPWTGFSRKSLEAADAQTRWKRTRQLGD